MMKKDDCIFCKLANGEIPTNTLYEDEAFRVIFDLNPVTKGHALIVPKEHYANLYELSDESAARALVLAKKMATVMTEVFQAEGFNLLQNNGECAGQTVFHFHIHLLPRYKSDHALKFGKPGVAEAEQLQAWCKEIQESVKKI